MSAAPAPEWPPKDSKDGAVQATADDAGQSKRSAVTLGYYTDDFIAYFNPKPSRRSPLINRGYYARVVAIRRILQQFVEHTAGAAATAQIVCVGAGMDSTFFALQAALPNAHTRLRYFEVDFKEVVAAKAAVIARTPQLHTALAPGAQASADGVTSSSYSLLAADIRDCSAMEHALLKAGLQRQAPVLFLSECVLVYLQPAEGDAIVRWAAGFVNGGAGGVFVTYEQIHPHDAFGQVMMRNLVTRGCPLYSLEAYPDLSCQKARYLSAGWQLASAKDLDDIYENELGAEELKRVSKLELFDEFEEWHMISQHYTIVIASSRTFSDLTWKSDVLASNQ